MSVGCEAECGGVVGKEGVQSPSGLQRENMAESEGLSDILSVTTPLRPYGTAYRRVGGLTLLRLFKKSFAVRCVAG